MSYSFCSFSHEFDALEKSNLIRYSCNITKGEHSTITKCFNIRNEIQFFSGNWIMNLHNYLYKYIHTKKLKIILFFLCPFKMKKKTCQKRTCWSTISVKSLNECTIFPFLVHLVNITRKSASLKAAKSSWWWLWIEDLSCRNVFWALTTVTQANHLLVLLVVHMFSKWEKNRD